MELSVLLNREKLARRTIARIILTSCILLVVLVLVVVLFDLTWLLIFGGINLGLGYLLVGRLVRCLKKLKMSAPKISVVGGRMGVPGTYLVDTKRWIDIRSIKSVEYFGSHREAMIIGIKDRFPVTIERSILADRDGMERIAVCLGEMIDKKTVFCANQHPPSDRLGYVVTLPLMVSLIAVFAITHALPGSMVASESVLLAGANAKSAFSIHDWHRLFSSVFIHYNFPHLMANICAIGLLGPILERLLGAVRLGVLVLMSALIGSVFSLAFSSFDFSVGASAGIFGMLGLFTAVKIRFHQQLPATISPAPLKIVVVLMGLELIAGFLIPFVDGYAHLGGFLLGLLIGSVIGERGQWHTLKLAKSARKLNLEVSLLYAVSFVYAYSIFVFLQKIFPVN